MIILVIFIIIFATLLRPVKNNTIYTVERGNIVNTLLVNGTYTTASQAQVNSPADDIMTKLYVNNGDEVKKGNPLFHIESTATDEEKAAAYATYLSDASVVTADKAALYSLQSTMFAAWKTYYDLSTK